MHHNNVLWSDMAVIAVILMLTFTAGWFVGALVLGFQKNKKKLSRKFNDLMALIYQANKKKGDRKWNS